MSKRWSDHISIGRIVCSDGRMCCNHRRCFMIEHLILRMFAHQIFRFLNHSRAGVCVEVTGRNWLGKQWFLEEIIQIFVLIQQTVGLEKDILNLIVCLVLKTFRKEFIFFTHLSEYFPVVSRSRCICQIEWFLNAQRLPVIRIIFRCANIFALLD